MLVDAILALALVGLALVVALVPRYLSGLGLYPLDPSTIVPPTGG